MSSVMPQFPSGYSGKFTASSDAGVPVAAAAYMLTSSNGQKLFGRTDENGETVPVYSSNPNEPFEVEMIQSDYWYDSENIVERGYSFNNVVKPGDWTPSTMKCYDNENIVIGYHLGLDEEESVKGSLLSYIDAPFIDLSGNFITGNKLSELRSREMKNPYDNTRIDFISNR
ncbi:hypothetical protein NBO_252g0002, partial [Nosema bombycis CQ1]